MKNEKIDKIMNIEVKPFEIYTEFDPINYLMLFSNMTREEAFEWIRLEALKPTARAATMRRLVKWIQGKISNDYVGKQKRNMK